LRSLVEIDLLCSILVTQRNNSRKKLKDEQLIIFLEVCIVHYLVNIQCICSSIQVECSQTLTITKILRSTSSLLLLH
jgi:hypothetical protein